MKWQFRFVHHWEGVNWRALIYPKTHWMNWMFEWNLISECWKNKRFRQFGTRHEGDFQHTFILCIVENIYGWICFVIYLVDICICIVVVFRPANTQQMQTIKMFVGFVIKVLQRLFTWWQTHNLTYTVYHLNYFSGH